MSDNTSTRLRVIELFTTTDPARARCAACDGEGELLCGLYPPPECDVCNGSGGVEVREP